MMKRHLPLPALYGLLLSAQTLPALAASPALLVVEDRGGVPALPYYQALNLQADAPAAAQATPQAIATPAQPATEADMLLVRSRRLSPGEVPRRAIRASVSRPLFLVGDDERSRAWLRQRQRQRQAQLRGLHAVGLVVEVESLAALSALRRLAPGLSLSPASGDDLAMRLGLRHYPVLITATGVAQ